MGAERASPCARTHPGTGEVGLGSSGTLTGTNLELRPERSSCYQLQVFLHAAETG